MVEEDQRRAAGIIPLKTNDMEREFERLRARAEKNELHGWLLFRFYNNGAHSRVIFGCCHAERLSLAAAVLQQDAVARVTAITDEEDDA